MYEIHLMHACTYGHACMRCIHTYTSIVLFWTCQIFCAHQCTAASCRCTRSFCRQGRMPSCLHAPLCWLLGKVLDERQPALESNHGLVSRELAGGAVSLLKILDQGIKEGSNLEKRIVTWLTFLDILLSLKCRNFRRIEKWSCLIICL